MSKRVYITLLQTCMIAGLPRSPAEGVQEVDKKDADRLIDANMAELADMSGEAVGDGDDDDHEDHLESRSVKQLRAIAKRGSITVPTNATKPQLIEAIRLGVREQARDQLKGYDRERLLEIVKDEELVVAEDATDDEIREAIFDHTFPPAA